MGHQTPVCCSQPLAQSPSSSPAANIITRKIPRTGELLPAIGLGTDLTFDKLHEQPPYPGKTFPGIIRRAQNQRAAAAK